MTKGKEWVWHTQGTKKRPVLLEHSWGEGREHRQGQTTLGFVGLVASSGGIASVQGSSNIVWPNILERPLLGAVSIMDWRGKSGS